MKISAKPQQIVIVGSGFAGMMAALAASRLRHEKNVSPAALAITVVSPEPEMVVRPRLYERKPETMVAPLGDLFAATDIDHVRGTVDRIDSVAGVIGLKGPDGETSTLPFDRLVLASGSEGFGPPIPALRNSATVRRRLKMRWHSIATSMRLPIVPPRPRATPWWSAAAASPALRSLPRCRVDCGKSWARTPRSA